MPSRSRRTLACAHRTRRPPAIGGSETRISPPCSAFIGPRRAKDSCGGDACSLHHDPRTTRGKGPYAPELRSLVTCVTIRSSCSHRMTPPSCDGSSITLGPGSRVRLTPRAPRSRRTTTESRCSPFTVGCQTACARRTDANRPACERVQAGRSGRSFGRNAGGTYPVRPCPVPPAFWFL